MHTYSKVTPFRRSSQNNANGGTVTLVGAGAGGLDCLTIGALKSIASAEVVFYDALVTEDVLAVIPKSAIAIYTGKRCGQHALTQSEISELLVHWAKLGFQVVRLKAGDPFIFGRGSEEVAALRADGIKYRIIAGLSALNAVAANFTLPLTMRGSANEFRAIQGHHLPDDQSYWRDLARYNGTVIIFMGSEKLQEIAGRLIKSGKDATTLLAMIETDSNGQQSVQRGTLDHAAHGLIRRENGGPAIIYIGQNVAFMDACPSEYNHKDDHIRTRKDDRDGIATAYFS